MSACPFDVVPRVCGLAILVQTTWEAHEQCMKNKKSFQKKKKKKNRVFVCDETPNKTQMLYVRE